jgi:restriction system protein
MSIPDYQTLMLPVLQASAVGEAKLGDLTEQLADEFQLTPEERNALLPSGRQTTLANRIGWAKTYLGKAGLVESKRRGYFNATSRGRQVLEKRPARIDVAFLSQYLEFEQFRRAGREEQSNGNEPAAGLTESSKTPDELLIATHEAIEKSLRADLLDRVLSAPPAFFESTIVTLLLNMGYGGSRREAGRAIGRSGDGGLDGVIDQDLLGLDRVYIQAKRYQAGSVVGEPEIRGFAGSLQGAKATKGVFVTTASSLRRLAHSQKRLEAELS